MTQKKKRIYLSPPHLSGEELKYVTDAFESNWIAPLGPHVDAFEKEFSTFLGIGHAAALSSGTAALHLAVRMLGVQPGDEVICPTLTFCATANAVIYEGARPVFLDIDPTTWTLDTNLLAEELKESAQRGKLPKALIAVDLYGQCANYDAILDICSQYDIPVIEDAAEALGATYGSRKAGVFGKIGIFSFNGNKIITTSGGGMLVSEEESYVRRAKFLSTQARDPAPHYQHTMVGYNYRLSNILAAIGRAQLKVLPERVDARRKVFETYRRALEGYSGIGFMPEALYGKSSRWLTCITIDEKLFGANREEIRSCLERQDIEARPIWKPLHLQPAYSHLRTRGGTVAEKIFDQGLCLPSGSNLTSDDLQFVISFITNLYNEIHS